MGTDKKTSGMKISGILASSATDSSGERLDIDGADISDYEQGLGAVNWEHQGASKGDQGREIVGKIVSARKIYSESDCENEDQLHYWNLFKLPMIYGVIRLYDAAGHEGAKAIAAQIRDHVANNEPISVKFSVEGTTVVREGNLLKETILRACALTLRPCNKTAVSGLLQDPNAPEGWKKDHVDSEDEDILARVAQDAKKFELPDGMEKLGKAVEVLYVPFDQPLAKTYTAGSTDAAPSALTGGSALQRENLVTKKTWRKKATEVVAKFLKGESEDKKDLETNLRNELPEASDEFIGHFMNIAEDYIVKLRKSENSGTKWAYHGTHSGVLESIEQHGLVAQDGEAHHYFSEHEDSGFDYAQHRARQNKQNPVVLRFPFPTDAAANPHVEDQPEHERPHGEYVSRTPVHPSAIEAWHKPSKSWRKLSELRKDEKPIEGAKPKAAAKPKATPKAKAPPKGTAHLKAPEPALEPLTVQGKPVPASKIYSKGKAGGVFFDEKEGALHTGRGVFHMNTVTRPHPHQAEKWDQETMQGTFASALSGSRPAHQRAMQNWLPLNKKFCEGKTDPGLVSHSVLFALMSPGNPVAMQEHMFSHAIDAMHAHGMDSVLTPDQWRKAGGSWLDTNWSPGEPGKLPEHSNDYFKHLIDMAGPGKGVKGLYTKDGRVQSFGKPKQLYDYYMGYLADHHDKVMEAIKDTRGDGRQIARMLCEANGFGNKLARYTVGMMGGGNLTVPDTHFLRHSFGLLPDVEGQRPGASPDNATFGHIRDATTSGPKANDVMEAIDRHYMANHPSVKAVMSDPILGQHFKDRPDQALFPSFWWHWTSVAPHERALGTPPAFASNGNTDHRPFFDATSQFRKSETEYDHELPIKTAAQHHLWVREHGPEEAWHMYMEQLAPMLAANDALKPWIERPKQEALVAPVAQQVVFKAEALIVDLRKALSDGSTGGDKGLAEIAPHIHHAYDFKVDPQTFAVKRHAAGRFTTAGNHLHILEDYHGDLGHALQEGPLSDQHHEQIAQMKTGHRFDVASMHEIHSGARPELWSPTPKVATKKPSVFAYHRTDQAHPDHLEFMNGTAHINGHPMNHEQVNAILGHIKAGNATLRYKQGISGPAEAIQKMSYVLENLFKTDGEADTAQNVHAAMGKLDELVRAGHLEPHHAEALRNHAFKDPMTGNVMGNKFAYTDFRNRSEAKGGIHVVTDSNDFKAINDKYGHETGDKAIKAIGLAMRAAADEVAPGQNKLFRIGGDEGAAHFPTHDHAAAYARSLRNKLDALPAIHGTHKLSVSFGFGVSPEHADKALYEAKKQKYDPAGMTHPDSRKWVSKYAPGQAPHFAHSLVPGFEGAVPLDDSQLQVKAPMPPEEVAKPSFSAASPTPSVPQKDQTKTL